MPDPMRLLVYQGQLKVNKSSLTTSPSIAVPTPGNRNPSSLTLVWSLVSSASPSLIPWHLSPSPPLQVSHHVPFHGTCPQRFWELKRPSPRPANTPPPSPGPELLFGRYHILFCFRSASSSKARPDLHGRAPHGPSCA